MMYGRAARRRVPSQSPEDSMHNLYYVGLDITNNPSAIR